MEWVKTHSILSKQYKIAISHSIGTGFNPFEKNKKIKRL
jgi:hypothetical protein